MEAEKVLEQLKLWLGREYWKAEGVCEFLQANRDWSREHYFRIRSNGVREILSKIRELEDETEGQLVEESKTEEPVKQEETAESENVLEEPIENSGPIVKIEELYLSTVACGALRRAGIFSVNRLTTKTEEDLLKIKHFGSKSLGEVKKALEERNLSLAVKYDESRT